MPETQDRSPTATISALVSGCYTACERPLERRAYRLRRGQQWLRRRDTYAAAAAALPGHMPERQRAEMLAVSAAWTMLAWTALADGDAYAAWTARRQAARAFKLAVKGAKA